MKDFIVSVRKVTDESLMREACEMTFLGKSHQSLLSIYKSEHSPVRTQMFWVTFKNIPLFVATHLLRHHVGSTPYQLTCRDDRQGGNPNLPERVQKLIGRVMSLTHEATDSSDFDIEVDTICSELEDIAENTDRQTPVNLGLFLNAQSLIDMSKVRICMQAHKDTRVIFGALKDKIHEIDPALAEMMVAKCVYRNGLCGEPRCCGFNSTPAFKKDLEQYLNNFSDKQKGICK